jgi:hypothetical protein
MTTAKRIGRPMNKPAKGTRVSLGLKVTAEVKRHVDAAAQASGRTQSQEAEALIEKALQYDRVLAASGTTSEKLLEGALRAVGYTPVHSPHGKIWLPPGYPTQRSGFISPEEEQS